MLLDSFAKSTSFDDAGFKSSLLVKMDGITTNQIRKVANAILANGQILGSSWADKYLPNFLKDHKDSIGLSARRKLSNSYKYKLLSPT